MTISISRNDDNRTLHVLGKVCELLVCWCMQYSSGDFNHDKATRAGACIIQILQELELEPALLKVERTGRVSN